MLNKNFIYLGESCIGWMDRQIGNVKKNKQTTNSMCNMILNIRKMHQKK